MMGVILLAAMLLAPSAWADSPDISARRLLSGWRDPDRKHADAGRGHRERLARFARGEGSLLSATEGRPGHERLGIDSSRIIPTWRTAAEGTAGVSRFDLDLGRRHADYGSCHEPMNAVVRFEGDEAKIWTGSQLQPGAFARRATWGRLTHLAHRRQRRTRGSGLSISWSGETEFCGPRLAGYFRRRMRENSRNSVRRPRCASLTRWNYGGFCLPGNRPGLSGLHGGARRN